MGIKIKTGAAPSAWYVPEFGGNRTLPESERAAVELLPMTSAQLNSKRERDFAGIRAGASTAHVQRATRAHRDAVVESNMLSAEGVAFEDASGKEVVIKSGRDLVAEVRKAGDASADDILDEIYLAITNLSKLEDGRRPNS